MNGGGAQRIMLTLANSLAKKGLNVDLVLNRAEGPYMQEISERVNIITLGTSRAITSIIPLAYYIRNNKPDAILSAMNYINVITVLAKFLSFTNSKVVLSEHAYLSASLSQINKPIFNKIFKCFMSLTYRHADGIVAVSNSVADDLSKQLGIKRKKINTIYNPIVISDIVKKKDEVIENSWLLSKSVKTIIGVGRLSNEKNFSMLIKAFSLVQNKVDCKLIILGQGELETELKDLVKQLGLDNKVLFPGFSNNPYAWMTKADLFVLSSNHEGFGNVLVEAMACGTPIISTDCPGGPNEILEGGIWGDLVPVGDVKSLSDAIIRALSHPRCKSSSDLQNRASLFNVENAVNNYLTVLIP